MPMPPHNSPPRPCRWRANRRGVALVYTLLLSISGASMIDARAAGAQAPDTLPRTPAQRGAVRGDQTAASLDVTAPAKIVADTLGAVRSAPVGWVVERPTLVLWEGANDALRAAIDSSAFTLEAWVVPYEPLVALGLPAPSATRLISHCAVSDSTGPRRRNLALDVARVGDVVRCAWYVRTTETSDEGTPRLEVEIERRGTSPLHVVLTHDREGVETLYLDGAPVARKSRPGSLANWDAAAELHLFGEPGAYHPWRGELHALRFRAGADDSLSVRRAADSSAPPPSAGWLRSAPKATQLFVRGANLTGEVLLPLTNAGQGPLTWQASLVDGPEWLSIAEPLANGLDPMSSTALQFVLDGTALESSRSTVAPRRETARIRLVVVAPGAPTDVLEREVQIEHLTEATAQPDAESTGPQGTELRSIPSGFTVREPGTVLTNVHVHGALLIDADDVVLRDVMVDGGDARFALRLAAQRRNLTLERVWVRGGLEATLAVRDCTMRASRVDAGPGIAALFLGDVTCADSWIRSNTDDSPAIRIVDVGRVQILSTRIDAARGSYAALALESTRGAVRGVALERSWIHGGRFAIVARDGGHGAPTAIALRGNSFAQETLVDTLFAPSFEGWHAESNYLASSGLPVTLPAGSNATRP